MFRKITFRQKTNRLICNWVATGNPRQPFACAWSETSRPSALEPATGATEELGRMPLCA